MWHRNDMLHLYVAFCGLNLPIIVTVNVFFFFLFISQYQETIIQIILGKLCIGSVSRICLDLANCALALLAEFAWIEPSVILALSPLNNSSAVVESAQLI